MTSPHVYILEFSTWRTVVLNWKGLWYGVLTKSSIFLFLCMLIRIILKKDPVRQYIQTCRIYETLALYTTGAESSVSLSHSCQGNDPSNHTWKHNDNNDKNYKCQQTDETDN